MKGDREGETDRDREGERQTETFREREKELKKHHSQREGGNGEGKRARESSVLIELCGGCFTFLPWMKDHHHNQPSTMGLSTHTG